jgi:hypothetical protein
MTCVLEGKSAAESVGGTHSRRSDSLSGRTKWTLWATLSQAITRGAHKMRGIVWFCVLLGTLTKLPTAACSLPKRVADTRDTMKLYLFESLTRRDDDWYP